MKRLICSMMAGAVASLVGAQANDHLFPEMLASTPTLRGIAAEPARYRLQIIIGEINEASSAVKWHAFRAGAEYFYPASTVKLPVAALALVELRRLGETLGASPTGHEPMTFYPLFNGESTEAADASNLDGQAITLAHDIRKVLLVSDNAAYNRLYEFVGHDRANAALHDNAELTGVMLTHRLSEYRSPEQNRMSPRISIVIGDRTINIPERISRYSYAPELATPISIPLGRGYMTGSGLVGEPMEFADNNRMSLMDLLRVVRMITRPDLDDGDRLGLRNDDRAFLMHAMGEWPRESANPVYDPADYPDAWGKFLLPGVRRVFPGDRVRIYNKIGRAYGTSTDAAYILDTETGRGVFVAVTMYTNDNAILNDNIYEYETLADPAMADIGAFVAERFLLDPETRP